MSSCEQSKRSQLTHITLDIISRISLLISIYEGIKICQQFFQRVHATLKHTTRLNAGKDNVTHAPCNISAGQLRNSRTFVKRANQQLPQRRITRGDTHFLHAVCVVDAHLFQEIFDVWLMFDDKLHRIRDRKTKALSRGQSVFEFNNRRQKFQKKNEKKKNIPETWKHDQSLKAINCRSVSVDHHNHVRRIAVCCNQYTISFASPIYLTVDCKRWPESIGPGRDQHIVCYVLYSLLNLHAYK